MSLREGKLAILVCKEGCLVLASAHVRVWLLSWSCAHVASWCGVILRCQSWCPCWHGVGSPAILCDVRSSWPLSSSLILLVASVRVYVVAPTSFAILLVVKPVTKILSLGVMALVGLVGLESQGHSCEPHPVVGGTIRPSRQAIADGGSLYRSSPPSSVVLSVQRGAGMAFFQTEGIVVHSVLME
jgi:hypothetical protein